MKTSVNPHSQRARRARMSGGFLAAPTFALPAPGSRAFTRPLEAEMPAWKRGLDLACILLALPLILLVLAALAAFIKTVSRGPVFFVQERVGYRGRRFPCWKFRSMKAGADTETHREHVLELQRSDAPMTKLDVAGDPRLIPGGALLRASGLDELPQLLNVCRGEMSLVGPRPCLPYEAEAYLPWQRARFDTPPGLTGLWQVSGKNRTTFTEMIRLDIYYAHHSSLFLDLRILSRTLGVLAGQVRGLRRKAANLRRARFGLDLGSGLTAPSLARWKGLARSAAKRAGAPNPTTGTTESLW